MSIYTYSQKSFDLQNQTLSEIFNIGYTRIELSDEERTVATYHNLRHGPSKTGRTSEDFTPEWKKKISESKLGVPSNQKWTQEEREFSRQKALKENFNVICKGRIWINNGTKNLRIQPEHLSQYPGYIRGRLV